jgi:hypothetical protein
MKTTHHAARVTAEIDSAGILTAALSGPVTAVTVQAFRAKLEAHYGRKVTGFVVDYRRAVIAFAADEIAAQAQNSGLIFGPPAAILLRTEQLDLFRDYAWQAARAGALRQLFTDAGAALEWARLEAQLAPR